MDAEGRGYLLRGQVIASLGDRAKGMKDIAEAIRRGSLDRGCRDSQA